MSGANLLTMNTTPLSDFCRTHTQIAAARLLGWTQGAVSQALIAGRDIHLVQHDDGTYSAYEVRQIAGRPVHVLPVADIGTAPVSVGEAA
jgi:hypothetical protein